MAKNNSKVGVGLGITAAVAAAAAGVYYFYASSDATKHRKAVKSWAVKAKGDVLERLENMKEVTKESYDQAVAEVMDHYKTLKGVPSSELTKLGKELHGHWKAITKSLQTTHSRKTSKPKSRKK